MDEDLIAMLAVMSLFVSFPIAVVAITTGCIAYARTKAWDKERNQKEVNAEASSALLDSNSNDADSDSDFLDTDDEAEHTARKTEEASDRLLTFGQMYRKQFRKVWCGKNAQQIIKEREREERRKLAKAVAKELERRERRRARRAEREAGFEAAPPSYKN